jgi:NAD(P)-dependent dehydrogenase (short-subunit alcohol dehydrogenase family)
MEVFMNCLIIGGTSGLGLSLAHALKDTYTVYVTGRREFKDEDIAFLPLDLSQAEGLEERIGAVIKETPKLDLLIYAAGFFQDGTITDVDQEGIEAMLNVGLVAAMYVVRDVLTRQESLPEFVAITSTSQWTPRLREPVYTAVKAGLGAFSNSLALDPRVGKVLVAGPAGMATDFWKDTDPVAHDTAQMLDPEWVAEVINDARQEVYQYKFVRILRKPSRIEVAEKRI